MTVKISYNGFKKKNREKQIICVDCGVAKHRLGALMAKTVPKTRGYVSFIPALDVFSRFFLRETDRTSLMNIRTKGEVLKPLRSREISC